MPRNGAATKFQDSGGIKRGSLPIGFPSLVSHAHGQRGLRVCRERNKSARYPTGQEQMEMKGGRVKRPSRGNITKRRANSQHPPNKKSRSRLMLRVQGDTGARGSRLRDPGARGLVETTFRSAQTCSRGHLRMSSLSRSALLLTSTPCRRRSLLNWGHGLGLEFAPTSPSFDPSATGLVSGKPFPEEGRPLSGSLFNDLSSGVRLILLGRVC